MTIYECNDKTIYKVTGEISCNTCHTTVDETFTVRCLEKLKRIKGRDKLGRVYRKCKYITRPEDMCQCSPHVWIASDAIVVESS